jgi:hypothetical protein
MENVLLLWEADNVVCSCNCIFSAGRLYISQVWAYISSELNLSFALICKPERGNVPSHMACVQHSECVRILPHWANSSVQCTEVCWTSSLANVALNFSITSSHLHTEHNMLCHIYVLLLWLFLARLAKCNCHVRYTCCVLLFRQKSYSVYWPNCLFWVAIIVKIEKQKKITLRTS